MKHAKFLCSLLVSVLLVLPASGADLTAPEVGFSNETEATSGEQTVVAEWLWTWARANSAIGIREKVVYQVTWAEEYEGGERQSASIQTLAVGAGGRADCTLDIDDQAGTAEVGGTISVLGMPPRPCTYASISLSIDDGDDRFCVAYGFFTAFGEDGQGFQAQSYGPATGLCGI